MAKIEYEIIKTCSRCGVTQELTGVMGTKEKWQEGRRCASCGSMLVFSYQDLKNAHIDKCIESVEVTTSTDDEPEFDVVNKPQGYNSYDLETINAIRGQSTDEEFQGYLKGNVMKYVARYNFKNGVEDLEKLIIYAEFLRDHVKGEWKK